jgi:hypothetical protein
MGKQPTIYLLSDNEIDAVTGGKKKDGGDGGTTTVVEIVEISIGEIVATGHSTVTLDVAGAGDTSTSSSGGHKKH